MEACIWYIKDIRIHSNNIEAKQQGIVEKVLQKSVKHRLTVNLRERNFHVDKTMFLVHVSIVRI